MTLYFQSNRVASLGDKWAGVQTELQGAARSVGDTSGDWSPAVVGAVQSFGREWQSDINQLGAEAKTTSDGIKTAAREFDITETRVTELMERIQKSI